MRLIWTSGGKTRGFNPKRPWPTCAYTTGASAGFITGEIGYSPSDAETAILSVWVAVRNGTAQGFDNRRMVKRAVGLKAAKAQLNNFLQSHPEHGPIDLR